MLTYTFILTVSELFIWWLFFVYIKNKKIATNAILLISTALFVTAILVASSSYRSTILSLFTVGPNAKLFLITIALGVIVYFGTLATIKDTNIIEKIKIPGLLFLLGILFGSICKKLAPCMIIVTLRSSCRGTGLSTLLNDKISIICLFLVSMVLIFGSLRILQINSKK